jgi:hypothetical protein
MVGAFGRPGVLLMPKQQHTRVLFLFVTFGSAFAFGCRPKDGHPIPATIGVFAIPRAREAIVVDGKCGEESWQTAFRSPSFIDAQGRRNPSAQLRATADNDNLYIEVYVADIDIESAGDVIKLDVGPVQVELTPKGAKAPPGVRTAVDTDDTIDNAKDDDEEWINELAIPWSLLKSYDVPVRVLRIDVGRNGPSHAMAWPRNGLALLRFDPGGAR